ncbi:MAG: MOSC domain-containing protein [Gemmatimonadales bacterium]
MTETGQVFSINCSPGGVPKLPVPEGLITTSGIFGDSHRDTRHHGGPDRAVSIFSAERIRALQDEGHPITTGSTGENITLNGIDWDLVEPGCLLEIGDALLEITSYATPCRTIKDSFIDERFIRMSHKHFPGWSRVYARVLREGMVRTGDAATLTQSGLKAKGWLESLLS